MKFLLGIAGLMLLWSCSTPERIIRTTECPDVSVLYEGHKLYRFEGEVSSEKKLRYYAQLQFGATECTFNINTKLVEYSVPLYIQIDKGPAYRDKEEEIAVTSTILYGNEIINTSLKNFKIIGAKDQKMQITYNLPVELSVADDPIIRNYKHILSLQLTEEEINNRRRN